MEMVEQKVIDEVPIYFVISDIHVLEMKGRVCQSCQKQYGLCK